MALPGLRRLDHIGFTVPDLDEAHRGSSSTCSAASTSTPSARSATTTATGWPAPERRTRAR